MNGSPYIFSKHSKVFTKIDIAAKFINGFLPPSDLGRSSGTPQPIRERLFSGKSARQRQELKQGPFAEEVQVGRIRVVFVNVPVAWIAGSDPPVLDARQSALIEKRRTLSLSPKLANPFVTRNENDECGDRNQHPPAGKNMNAGRQPHDNKEDDSGAKPRVADQQVEFLIALHLLTALTKTPLVLLGGVHFSGAQFFTSEAMLPRSELRPYPNPKRPPRTERIKVLELSRGRAATLRQKASQIPSCSRYISTF